jgi:predicted DNA-binding transcriptional regulator AlpA
MSFNNPLESKTPVQPKTPTPTPKSSPAIPTLMSAKDAAATLKVSLSWLAKARMRGDGPPYIKIGRSIRYAEAALIQWMKSRQRSSTSGQ